MKFFDKLFGSNEQSKVENNEDLFDADSKTLKSKDRFRDSDYFYEYIERIKPFSQRTYNGFIDAQKQNNITGIKNWSRGLAEGLIVKPSIWYSMGKPIDYTWQIFYKEYINYYKLSISKDLINGSYQYSLRILSIGILLGADKEEFKKISERYVEEGYEDYILDRLIHSQYPSHPISTELQFPNEIYIQKLAQILKSSSAQESETMAKESLEKYFYTKENLQTSYDSHKTEFYSGYWAWEIAAFVKILALDDSSFKDNPYYPYDMVHWQEN